MISYEELRVSTQDLLFDPNNYRFQDLDEYVPAEEGRFHEESVQTRADRRLKEDEGLIALKKSILTNGYVPSEKIIVRPYSKVPGKYVVVEGNRRLAAAKWIIEDSEAGVEIPEEVLDSVRALPIVVAEGDAVDAAVMRAALMGIRHVSGIKEWGGYQRAKLVVTMRDELELSAPDVALRLGMSTQEVNRRYRAFKALQQMQEDEEYGIYFKPSMYNLFHEAVSLPIVKDWLGWDDANSKFVNADELHKFYSLISPRNPEEAGTKEPKISTYDQVRDLRVILPKAEAKRILLDDPTGKFVDALALARQDELSRSWAADVAAAVRSLGLMGVRDLKNLGEEDVHMLTKLRELIDERLSDHQVLKGR